tara:strand:+ start:590 stop:1498 length:909 start_codon:yes stop_codon:yes gene_type:complete
MAAVTFYTYDGADRTQDTALESVQVRVYSLDGETFVTLGTTDSDGEVVFDLTDDTTYWVRCFKTGFAFESKLSADVASDDVSFSVEGANLRELPPSTADNLCRVSGYVVNVAGAPVGGISFYFMISDYIKIVGSTMVTATKLSVLSDSEGYVEVELIQGAVYEVMAEGWIDETIRVKVPESQSASITELLWPYPARVELSDTELSIAEGSSESVTYSVVLSSGVTTPFYYSDSEKISSGTYVGISTSDAAVASIGGTEAGTVVITGESAGTATISFEAKSSSYRRRSPELSLSFDAITITVA